MERPPRLSPKIAVGIIILFHAVGLCGFFLPSLRPWFVRVVPFHILLMFVTILLSWPQFSKRFIWFLLLVYLLAYNVEWIGVHTGWIFGHYTYGATLGLKLSAVPIIIGINWFLLVLGAAVTTRCVGIKSPWIRVPVGALLLVLLDILIEPIAIRFDYWHWSDSLIPLKNYLDWFIAGAIMLGIFEILNIKGRSVVPMVLLVVQYLFFAALHWA